MFAESQDAETYTRAKHCVLAVSAHNIELRKKYPEPISQTPNAIPKFSTTVQLIVPN